MSASGAITAVIVFALVGAGAFYLYQNGQFQDIRDVVRESAAGSRFDNVVPEFGEIVNEGEAELGENSITFSTDGEEVTYPTLFPNPRWNHMPIKVYMDRGTGEDLFGFDDQDLEYVRTAMERWEDETGGLVSFEEVDSLSDGELIVSWFPSLTEITEGRVVGEGGPSRAIGTGGRYTLVESGEVFLIPTDNECVGVNRPTHEIGHVLGLGHAPAGYGDVMFSKEISCKQKITEVTSAALEKLYEEKAGPDFVIERMSATKKGTLLDVNFTIRNTGLKESVHTSLKFLVDGEESSTLDAPRFSTMPAILPGAGITNRITNVGVPADAREIALIADYEDRNAEMNEENNRAVITFNN